MRSSRKQKRIWLESANLIVSQRCQAGRCERGGARAMRLGGRGEVPDGRSSGSEDCYSSSRGRKADGSAGGRSCGMVGGAGRAVKPAPYMDCSKVRERGRSVPIPWGLVLRGDLDDPQ